MVLLKEDIARAIGVFIQNSKINIILSSVFLLFFNLHQLEVYQNKNKNDHDHYKINLKNVHTLTHTETTHPV